MLHLLYRSTAVRPFNATELNELLECSREGNLRHGVTGLLLYRDGTFLQLIEGPDRAVERLLDNIRRDRRHRDVQLVLGVSGTTPYFEGWAMGHVRVEAVGPLDDLARFVRTAADHGRADAALALKLLRAFVDDRHWVFGNV